MVLGLLRRFGVEPERVASAAGIDIGALTDPESRIAYAAMGRLLRECADVTGCEYFGLLAGQQMGLSQLGFPGEMARNSPTLGAALRTFFLHHYLNSQGAVWVLSERDGLVFANYAVYEQSLEGIEQIYDGVVALAFNVIRELCGPRWLPSVPSGSG